MKQILLFFAFVVISLAGCKYNPVNNRGYFLDAKKGKDRNSGSQKKPLRTIGEVNKRLRMKASGVNLAGGQVFEGTLILDSIKGSFIDTIVISSYGEGRAVINGGNNEAIKITACSYIKIKGLDLKGNGRKEGNVTNGLAVSSSDKCYVVDINAEGFQKSGVDFYNCTHSEIRHVNASNNGFCGINIMGSSPNQSHNIIIKDSKAENNPGDPTNFVNHSGNGILAGVSDSVLIDHCSATNNGWDMPRIGNGPVGIWAWGSNNVMIQYCISYRNKTAKDAMDGGGFDLDGGITNSIIQYCLSYENQGAGYGLFQFSGASPWANNTVRYCVSINDGQVTKGSGGFFIWNGSNDISQLVNCQIYNNVAYNSGAPVISFETSSLHRNFVFCNNIMIGSDTPMKGDIGQTAFLGNVWWNPKGETKFMNYSSFKAWALKSGQEMHDGKLAGMYLDPKLHGPLTTDITDPYQLDKLSGYKLDDDSPLRDKGLDMTTLFGMKAPSKDFFGDPLPIGAYSEPGIYEMK